MSAIPLVQDQVRAKRQLVGLLEYVGRDLEITASQRADAEQKYGAAGRWLSDDKNLPLADAQIYSQGSMRLRTTVRPLGRDEFDVDLVCHLPSAAPASPAQIRSMVGDRLKAHGTYREILEPLNRGWRLNYAGNFHLDITPAVANPLCREGGVLVPDRELRCFKPSNPIGYADSFFSGCAAIEPRLASVGDRIIVMRGEQVEPLPEDLALKDPLRRIVQLLKRHRDIYVEGIDEPRAKKSAPISIIITTLATHAYRDCARATLYPTELDLIIAVLERMPSYIERQQARDGTFEFWIENPSTAGENFAEKWNSHPEREHMFHSWHQKALAQFRGFESLTSDILLAHGAGLDGVTQHFTEAFGERASKAVVGRLSETVNALRSNSRLTAGATGVLGLQHGERVRANTFFGR